MKTKMPNIRLDRIQEILNKLIDKIILRSDLCQEVREQAISEMRYYQTLFDNFEGLDAENQLTLLMDCEEMSKELYLWLNE